MAPTETQPPRRPHPHGVGNRLTRYLWGVTTVLLFRPSPRNLHRWRNLLLRLFGAALHPTARVYPRARVWAPWNLEMGEGSTIADDVDVYCVDRITIGPRSVISQYSYLCGATHDFEVRSRPLIPKPITIGADVWLAADVFVAPGVTIRDGAVVGARSSVFTDLEAWKVCVGSPARAVRDRVMREGESDGATERRSDGGGEEDGGGEGRVHGARSRGRGGGAGA